MTMTWAQYKEYISSIPDSEGIEYKTESAWLHRRRSLRAVSLNNTKAEAIRIPSIITDSYGIRCPVTAVGSGLFSNNHSVRDIILPEGISKIPARAFAGCTDLERIYFPGTIHSIDEAAFEGCVHLQDIFYDGSNSEWDKIYIVRNEYQIDFGSLIPGTPVHEVLDNRLVSIPGNEAINRATIHFNCNIGG